MLVEPKKAGRTLREIVNGINPNATPLPNQNVFARQSNPIASTGGAFSFVPKETPVFKPFGAPVTTFNSPTINVKLTGLIGEHDDTVKQKQNADQLEIVRSKAAAAQALAARERKKLQELEDKKKQEAAKIEEAKRLESERLLKEKKMQEEMIRQQERVKEREEEEKREEQRRRQQHHERQMAQMHMNVVKSQLAKRFLERILNDAVQEEVRSIVMKSMETKRYIKQITKPWLSRARAAVTKRVARAMERKRQWEFNMHVVCDNPYMGSDDTVYRAVPMHSRPEGIRDRVNQSILAEKIALENTPPVSLSLYVSFILQAS